MIYDKRYYRLLINKTNLISYQVKISESDLFISSDSDLGAQAYASLAKYRNFLESYIVKKPEFKTSLLPLPPDPLAPAIIRQMLDYSSLCSVGPMASVAGAISEFVGMDLSTLTPNLIIENGGDIAIVNNKKAVCGIYSNNPILGNKIGFELKARKTPLGICTSSGKIGHSISFGYADSVTVLSKKASVADGLATKIANEAVGQNSEDKVSNALEASENYKDLFEGVLIISQDNVESVIARGDGVEDALKEICPDVEIVLGGMMKKSI